jgi:hypothetical protein
VSSLACKREGGGGTRLVSLHVGPHDMCTLLRSMHSVIILGDSQTAGDAIAVSEVNFQALNSQETLACHCTNMQV